VALQPVLNRPVAATQTLPQPNWVLVQRTSISLVYDQYCRRFVTVSKCYKAFLSFPLLLTWPWKQRLVWSPTVSTEAQLLRHGPLRAPVCVLIVCVLMVHYAAGQVCSVQWSNCKIRARGTLSPPFPFFPFHFPYLSPPLFSSPTSFPSLRSRTQKSS